MGRELAAAYLGVSAGTLATVPVAPVRIGTRILWDRQALDAYVDRLGFGLGPPSGLVRRNDAQIAPTGELLRPARGRRPAS